MANLNFEQPPRSIANASLTARGGGGGLSTPTLAGHVTPTSGMFSGSSTSASGAVNSSVVGPNLSYHPGAGTSGAGSSQTGQQQQQLSPMGSRGLFGQRAFSTDRRTMPALGSVSQQLAASSFRRDDPDILSLDSNVFRSRFRNTNPMGGMGSFGIPPSRSYGSQGAINNFHSVFGGSSGGGGDTSTPPLLDLSEFPSLTNRGQGDSSMPQPSPMPGKQPYGKRLVHGPRLVSPDPRPSMPDVDKFGELKWCFGLAAVGMVKQPTSEASEFTMSSEDFPALPGTQSREGPSPGGGNVTGDKGMSVGLGPEISQDILQANRAPGLEKSQASKRGIQTSPDGPYNYLPFS